ncbi:hypothetical protein MMC29_005121 [Sticta canariensis]|nr:hypothetical protein [Sticta canariensis]
MDVDPEPLKPDGEASAEQAAAIAEEAKANAKLLKRADAKFWRRYRQFWRRLTTEVDPEQAKVGSKQTEADPEQLKTEEEALAERAAAHAEETKADAEVLRKQKELWSYLVIFFLHFRGCSARSILSVFQSFAIEGTEGDIARCIAENQLLTYKDVLPDDNQGAERVQIRQDTRLLRRRTHPRRNRDEFGRTEINRNTKPHVRTHSPEFIPAHDQPSAASRPWGRRRRRESTRKTETAGESSSKRGGNQIVITIVGFRQFYALGAAVLSLPKMHGTGSMGVEISPRNTLDFSNPGDFRFLDHGGFH